MEGGGIILCNSLDEKTYMRKKKSLSVLRYKFPIYIPAEGLLIKVNLLICIIVFLRVKLECFNDVYSYYVK